ncbi:MAG TPA: response regulator transcription factor, partial [Bacteroidales bacterium]|nr:response regulator transcription factor [Bacteroidales bacterium]
MANILVVEDEVLMLQGLKDNLEFEGYNVDTASNGADGLKKLLDKHYDLAILDVMMPEMSGFDVCRTARSRGIKTAIILLTAKAEEIDKV